MLLMGMSIALAGCPGTGVTNDPVGFVLAITRPVTAIARGGQGTMIVTATRQNGFTGAIALTGRGYGVNGVSVDPATIAAGVSTVTMTITIASTSSLTSAVQVVGNAAGYQEAVDIASFNVVTPGTFFLTETAGAITLSPGTTAHWSIKVNRTEYTQPVTLTASPAWASAGFTATVTPSVTQSNLVDNIIDLSVVIPASALGSFSLPVNATGAGSPDQALIIVFIVEPPTFGIFMQTSPLSVVVGGPGQPDVVSFVRHRYAGGITVTGSSDPGITISTDPFPTTADQATITVTAAAGTTLGTHPVTVRGVGATFQDSTTFSLIVSAPSLYTLTVATSPLNVVAGSSSTDNITINRPGFTGAVSLAATGDAAGITVTSNTGGGTTGTSAVLTVGVAAGVSAGTHVVTIHGLASGQTDVITTFAVVVTLPAGGTPTGLVVVPIPVTTTLGATQQFTAYLVDAQGNRTLPAAGWEISILSESTAIAQDQATPAYDIIQRWQTRPIKGVGIGSTQVHVAYDRISDGFTTFLILVTFTVTP